jgi:hypothetical protein
MNFDLLCLRPQRGSISISLKYIYKQLFWAQTKSNWDWWGDPYCCHRTKCPLLTAFFSLSPRSALVTFLPKGVMVGFWTFEWGFNSPKKIIKNVDRKCLETPEMARKLISHVFSVKDYGKLDIKCLGPFTLLVNLVYLEGFGKCSACFDLI